MKLAFCAVGVSLLVAVAMADPAPTTQPAPSSSRSLSADQMLDQMLKPASNPSRPLEPIPDKPATDKSSGSGALKPDAPHVNVLREGTFIIDRLGRLTHTQTGQAEITFESDGKTLKDPPMVIIPNLKLMQMEDQVTSSSRDLKFHVTGMVTEYRGRNYILLEKAQVISDVTQQF